MPIYTREPDTHVTFVYDADGDLWTRTSGDVLWDTKCGAVSRTWDGLQYDYGPLFTSLEDSDAHRLGDRSVVKLEHKPYTDEDLERAFLAARLHDARNNSPVLWDDRIEEIVGAALKELKGN